MLSDPQLRVATPPLRPQRYVTEMTRLLGHRGTRQGLGVSCHPWGMTPVFVTPWPLAPRRLSPGELTGASGEHRMPPARHPHGGARVAGHASAPVWARPLAGGLLLSHLVTIHPSEVALRVVTEHPWGLLRAQEGLRGRGSKGEAGTHHKEAGTCLPVGGTPLADPQAFSSSNPHSPTHLCT